MATLVNSPTDWEDLQFSQDVLGLRRTYRTKVHIDARPRMLRTLVKRGWEKADGYWRSPYTSFRYTERGALDVESLRGTFTAEYRENARRRAA